MAARSVSIKFSRAEVDQLLRYVEWRDEGNDRGWYYGHPVQFEDRHKSIIRKLVKAMTPDDQSVGR